MIHQKTDDPILNKMIDDWNCDYIKKFSNFGSQLEKLDKIEALDAEYQVYRKKMIRNRNTSWLVIPFLLSGFLFEEKMRLIVTGITMSFYFFCNVRSNWYALKCKGILKEIKDLG